MRKIAASLHCFVIAVLISLIWLPGTVSATAKECPGKASCHMVQKGEILSKIAVQYGVAVDDILRMNPTIKNRNRIWTDQVIILSEPAVADASKEVSVAATKPESQQTSNGLELKNKIQQLEADVLALTKAQAEAEKKLNFTSQALMTTTPVPMKKPKPPLIVSGLLCIGAIGFLIGKLANNHPAPDDLWRIIPHRPSHARGKPPRDEIQTRYQTRAKLYGGTTPWQVDIAAIRNPHTILLMQNSPSIFKQS